ncbi:MAG: aminotransferase class V-fold PLP-dependent enzyme [Chloroflexi bacterium]|nr:aminotransferase class V-fold PLP-dependent enzyme [Chloroflexota bacterium]
MSALAPKGDFIGVEERTHLAAGGETPFLKSHLEALTRYALDKSAGLPGRSRQLAMHDRARERAARLLGVDKDEVAFIPSTSDGVNMVAQSIDWRPGDNVVVETIEFPSDVYPWLLQREKGVEVRFVGTGFDVPPGALEAAVDERTRVVNVSQVSYLTGVRHDLGPIADAAHRVGALLVVDASHALGVVPVPARMADFVFSCCYKWQLGCTGIAVGFWNRQRNPEWAPKVAGWMSSAPASGELRRHDFTPRDDAMRMTLGNPSLPGAYVVDNGFRYLEEVGIERIEAHVLELTARLREGLAELDLHVLTPAEPERRAGNVCIARADGTAFAEALAERGVLVWEADGRIRYSVHLYNDGDDVDRALAATRYAVDTLGG